MTWLEQKRNRDRERDVELLMVVLQAERCNSGLRRTAIAAVCVFLVLLVAVSALWLKLESKGNYRGQEIEQKDYADPR